MSSKELDRYKQLYSEYIDHAVTVHNYHRVFANNVGLESGRILRTSLYAMVRLEKAMAKASQLAYKEHRENIKEKRAKLKEARARAKPRVMPIHKGKNKK